MVRSVRGRWVGSAGAGALALLLATGCSEDPQEKFEDAVARLEQARASLEEAQAAEEDEVEDLAEAQAELREARKAIERAESRVAKAREDVRASANDEVLFRAVQTRLLEELDDEAVDASVQGGVVTLSGEVANEAVRERASEIAEDVPGVVDVDNRLVVPAPPAPRAGTGS